jgi:phosphatidylethanolamine-binding protein (PEBP) family uncharacterized protein
MENRLLFFILKNNYAKQINLMNLIKIIALLIIGFLSSCKTETINTVVPTTNTFTAESSAFTNKGILPAKYTCDGLSISPPIAWKDAPTGTKSYAIIMHHIPPTGDKHVYMLVYNISNSVSSLIEKTANVGLFGINTVNGKTEYTPPCSQGPGAKLYVLTVYALSAEPVLGVAQSKVTMDILLDSISKTTLGTAVMNVNYTRP